MVRPRYPRNRWPAEPEKPENVYQALPHVHKFALNLFDRDDGEAADWGMIAETLLKAGFDTLDRLPLDDPRAVSILTRLHAGAYDRLVRNPRLSIEVSAAGQGTPSNTADLKSSFPSPENRRS